MTSSLPGAALGQAAEAAVVALAMGGDRAAFSELVKRRQSWLRNLLRRLCRDPTLADDLAQQVLLQAWRSLHHLRSVTSFAAWLRQLALNAYLAHLRAARPNVELSEEQSVDPPHVAEGMDLDRALATLSSAERTCIVLAYSEGMSHSEISAATALPVGTVKSHISRGAANLRSKLHAYQHDWGDRHVR